MEIHTLDENMERLKLLYNAGVSELVQPYWKTIWHYFQSQINIYISSKPVILLLSTFQRYVYIYAVKDMYITALFIMAPY